MILKRFSLAAVALIWLGGCQTLSQQDIFPETDAAIVDRPASPLLSDIVYSVLAGDIAVQRGRFPEANKHYFYAARLGRNAGLAELATKAALAGQDQEAAEQGVALWIELAPEDVGALQVAALLKAQENQLDAAVDYLRRVVAIKTEQGAKGYMEVARLLSKINNTQLRVELMRRLTVGQEGDPQALFALAIVEMSARNFSRAETAVVRVLQMRPDWTEARVLFVRVLAEQDKKLESRAALERFLKDNPKDTPLRAAYARLLVEHGELNAAYDQFRLLLKYKPEDGDTLFALGILALQLDRRDAAKDYFRRLFDVGAHRDDAAYYLGQVFEAEGRKREALGWYEKVSGENLSDARVRVAHIYVGLGEVRRAREILQQLRTQAGKDTTQIDLIESELLGEIKQYDSAMRVLDEALVRNPGDHDLLYARAMMAVNMGRVDLLERDLQLILKQDPNHADALNALGYTLADQTDRYQEALSYIKRAFELKPESAAILDSMGWVQYRMGNKQEALRYLWRAMELTPDSEIAAHLGEVLWEQGEHKRARKVWEDALSREPESEYLLRVLNRYKQHF